MHDCALTCVQLCVNIMLVSDIFCHSMTFLGGQCMDKKHKVISGADAREDLKRRGLTVRGWAKQHGLSSKVVFEVLAGRLAGKYGQAHKAAVLLGLKDGVVE